MSHFSKLALYTSSPRQPITPVARKRLNLLRKLELQINAAEAELRDELFYEDIKRWVRGEDGEKQLVVQQRPVRKWWWQHGTGAWMLTLRDGSKELPLGDGKASIEVGEISQLVGILQTIRSAVLAGELDAALESMAAKKKIAGTKKAAAKA